jgi:hypothetical protein
MRKLLRHHQVVRQDTYPDTGDRLTEHAFTRWVSAHAHRMLRQSIRCAGASAFAVLGLAACQNDVTPPTAIQGAVRVTRTNARGQASTQVLSATITTTNVGDFVVATLDDPVAGPVRFFVGEPVISGSAARASSIGVTRASAEAGQTSAPLTASTMASTAAGDATHPWATIDTGASSLRVMTAVNGVITAMANINKLTGDTLAVFTRNAWSDGTRLRSDFFSTRTQAGRADYDFRSIFAQVEVFEQGMNDRYGVALLREVLTICARGAFTLLSPTPLAAQQAPCDPAALQTAVSRAADLRSLAWGAAGATVLGGMWAGVTAGPGGVIIGGVVGVVAGGFGLLAAQANYNWAADDLYRCTHGGSEPPRCNKPTIGACKRVT